MTNLNSRICSPAKANVEAASKPAHRLSEFYIEKRPMALPPMQSSLMRVVTLPMSSANVSARRTAQAYPHSPNPVCDAYHNCGKIFAVRVQCRAATSSLATSKASSMPGARSALVTAEASSLCPTVSVRWRVGRQRTELERGAAKIPADCQMAARWLGAADPKGHVAVSPLGGGGGKSTRAHRIRVRSRRSERLRFLALGPAPTSQVATLHPES